ncbi:hypothetical protein H4S07_000037 [Coemansia furcata]|uniref:Uncharacterized protein n=1 Tax=Coemansia furcata TaxID=417177 RepID=A0ACC1LSD3_9FUNG|nr:hypothetical protein H4S07_000037 [Coemansia furcata]
MSGPSRQAAATGGSNTKSFAIINIRSCNNLNNSITSGGGVFMIPNKLNKKSSCTLSATTTGTHKAGEYADSMHMASSSVPTDTMYKLTLRGQYAHSKEVREAPAITMSPMPKQACGRGIPAGIDTNDEFAGRTSQGNSRPLVMSGVWLNVFYSEEKQWRKISFPPGITVGQARDICMLRFNVWHRVMERDMLSVKDCGNAESIVSGVSSHGSNNTRELYGLYWPAGGQWLESLRLVTKYGLSDGDILELQDVDAFIPTPVEVTKNILEVEHSRQQRPPVEKLSSSGMAESAIHYLYSKNLSISWKLSWLELADHQLVCRKKQSSGAQTLVQINLSRGFKLVDQHGNSTGPNEKLNRFSSDSSSEHSAGGTSTMASILGLAAVGRAQLGGDGSALIIKCEGKVHVFCTLSAVDHDSWRRALQAEKGYNMRGDGASTSASSFENQQNRWATPSSIAASSPAAAGGQSIGDTSSICVSSLGDRSVPAPIAPPPPIAPLPPPPSAPSVPDYPVEMSVRRSRSFVSSISRADWPVPPTTIPAAGTWKHHTRHQEQRAEMPQISRAASRTATDGLPSPGPMTPPAPGAQLRDHLNHRSLLLLPTTRFRWFRSSTSATSSPATPPKRGL